MAATNKMLHFRPILKRIVTNGASRLGYRVIPTRRLDTFEHARQLRYLLRSLDVDIVLDVGANDGGYRRLLRNDVGFTGRIVSFEPVPDVFESLAASAAGDSAWRGMPIALGNVDAELEMNVCHRSTMSSFLRRDQSALEDLGYTHLLNVTDIVGTRKVPVRRLDSLRDSLLEGRPDARVFLKCDTQGFDLEVIAGAERSLRSIVGLQIELSIKPIYAGAPRYADVIEKMAGLGFDVTGIYPVRRDELTRIVNFDCVMINSRHPFVADLAARLVVGRTPSVA